MGSKSTAVTRGQRFVAKEGDLCWDITRSEPTLLGSKAQANHSLGRELPEAASTEECPCGRWQAACGPSMCTELAVHFGERLSGSLGI